MSFYLFVANQLISYKLWFFSVPYGHHELYSGRSDYRTIPARGFKLINMVKILYGLRPYSYHKEYGCSCIQYSWQPYGTDRYRWPSRDPKKLYISEGTFWFSMFICTITWGHVPKKAVKHRKAWINEISEIAPSISALAQRTSKGLQSGWKCGAN